MCSNGVEASKVGVSQGGSGRAFGRGDDQGTGQVAEPSIRDLGGGAGGVALAKSLGQTGSTGRTFADGGLIPGKIA